MLKFNGLIPFSYSFCRTPQVGVSLMLNETFFFLNDLSFVSEALISANASRVVLLIYLEDTLSYFPWQVIK